MSLLSFIFPISQSISKYFRVFVRRSLPRYARCRQPPLTHDTNNSISTTHYTSPKYSVSRSASRCRTTSSTNPSLQLTSGNICCCCDICSVKKFAENRLGGFPKLIAVSFCLSICARRTQLSSCSPDMLSTSAIFIALPPLAILILSDHF